MAYLFLLCQKLKKIGKQIRKCSSNMLHIFRKTLYKTDKTNKDINKCFTNKCRNINYEI